MLLYVLPLVCFIIYILKNNGKQQNTQHRGADLDSHMTGVAAEFIRVGSTCNDNRTETGGNRAQQKQNPVTLFRKVSQFRQELFQSTASFLSAYSTIDTLKSKVMNCLSSVNETV